METSASYSDAYCTRQLKRAIGAEGKKLGFAVHTAAHGFRKDGEWLYDITWLRVHNNHVIDIPLALECEWIPGNETHWDFQKLLVSRARHRVLVMWARSRTAAEQVVTELERQIRRFKQTAVGDRYMFACYLHDANSFLFKVHVAGVGLNDGMQQSVRVASMGAFKSSRTFRRSGRSVGE
jgi:hypothetical protein